MAPRKRKRSLKAMREGNPRRPRSLQPLLRDGVTPTGYRRRDGRDWLSNMEAGHPEEKPPADPEAV